MGIILGIIALFMVLIMAMVLGMWLLPIVLGLLAVAFIVFCFVFWIWMLVDCIKNEKIGGNEKVAWVVAIALTHCLGALVYFIVDRLRRPRMTARPMM